MAEFPYFSGAEKLKRFFEQIQSSGKPSKVTFKYLEGLGFKSSYDRNIIQILKFIGFIDGNGAPTETWTKYRHRENAPKILASAVRSAYSELFSTFPDAYRKDTEAIRNFFSAHTDVGGTALAGMVSAFKALCELGDFEGDMAEPEGAVDDTDSNQEKPPRPFARAVAAMPAPPAVNINIQLQLPATADGEVYEKLFSAMKKHLFGS